MVACWLPVLLILMTFVVDVGNWFVHKRHLQMQADAGALAAAREFTRARDDAAISGQGRRVLGGRLQRRRSAARRPAAFTA